MGVLVSMMKERELKDVFIDFENAEVPEDDELGQTLQAILDRSATLLGEMESYEGCGDLIRTAMSQPGAETEQPAWVAVLPRVRELKAFFDFSLSLEAHIPKLLLALSGCGTANARSSIVEQQSKARQLAEIINFSMRFDSAKMRCPQLQNDFAFYRRVMSRHPDEQVVSDDDSYKISMFYAFSSPMMKSLATACGLLAKNEAGDSVAETLATMANVCLSMVTTGKFESEETNMFCLRVMAGTIVIYDSVSPLGVFYKKSPVMIKKALTTLKNYTPTPEGLLNSIKFSCAHFNDEDTPKSIKELLA